mmetsp:Transcript_17020/g.23809  ORF Transcript_17020/g.23809 Transcript_17020/m.23809 type:complete len:317 (+) Transcript_17020:165-1115(+)
MNSAAFKRLVLYDPFINYTSDDDFIKRLVGFGISFRIENSKNSELFVFGHHYILSSLSVDYYKNESFINHHDDFRKSIGRDVSWEVYVDLSKFKQRQLIVMINGYPEYTTIKTSFVEIKYTAHDLNRYMKNGELDEKNRDIVYLSVFKPMDNGTSFDRWLYKHIYELKDILVKDTFIEFGQFNSYDIPMKQLSTSFLSEITRYPRYYSFTEWKTVRLWSKSKIDSLKQFSEKNNFDFRPEITSFMGRNSVEILQHHKLSSFILLLFTQLTSLTVLSIGFSADFESSDLEFLLIVILSSVLSLILIRKAYIEVFISL